MTEISLHVQCACCYQDSGFPCFKGGPRTIQNLRKRFHLSLTEEVSWLIFGNHFLDFLLLIVVLWLQQCVSLVLSLISSSMDAWRTRQYDYYQRVLNGILWCMTSGEPESFGKQFPCILGANHGGRTGQFRADLSSIYASHLEHCLFLWYCTLAANYGKQKGACIVLLVIAPLWQLRSV